MRYGDVLKPGQFPGRRKALVLGAREGSGNIGEAVASELSSHGWGVTGDDCQVGDGSRPRGGTIPGPDVAVKHGYHVTDKGHYGRYEVPSYDDFKEGNYDALVISLGATYKGHFEDIPAHEVTRILSANLMMPLEAARRWVQANKALDDAKAELMNYKGPPRERKLVFVGSYAHRHPFTNGTLYCAAKAAINMAAQTLGWELTDRGYRVHVVHPYHVQGTPMWTQVEQDVMRSKDMTWEEADSYNRKDLKMPDLLTATQVADVIAALVTAAPGSGLEWVTGPIELNGGSR